MKKVYLLATIMALLTGCTVYIFSVNIQKASMNEIASTVDVAVALNDMAVNTIITEEMVQVKKLPAGSVTTGAAAAAEEVMGKVVKYPVLAGEQIMARKLRVPGEKEGNELSYQLLDNERAITIGVDEVTGVSGFIRAGDKVDIMTTDTVDNKPKTFYLFENVRVLKVSNKAANAAGTDINEYGTVTLCLSSDQSLVLGNAITLGKSIRLVLRPVTE